MPNPGKSIPSPGVITFLFLLLCSERGLHLLALSHSCFCFSAEKEQYFSWCYHVLVSVTLQRKSITSPGVFTFLFLLLCRERALLPLTLSCYCFCFSVARWRYFSSRYQVLVSVTLQGKSVTSPGVIMLCIVSVSLLRNKITFLAVITLLSRSCLCYFAQEKVLLLLFLGIIIFLQCPTSRIMLSLCLAFLIFFTLCTVFVTAFFVLKIYIYLYLYFLADLV